MSELNLHVLTFSWLLKIPSFFFQICLGTNLLATLRVQLIKETS